MAECLERVNMLSTLVARCPRHRFGMYAASSSQPRQLRDGSSSAWPAERLVVYGPVSLASASCLLFLKNLHLRCHAA